MRKALGWLRYCIGKPVWREHSLFPCNYVYINKIFLITFICSKAVAPVQIIVQNTFKSTCKGPLTSTSCFFHQFSHTTFSFFFFFPPEYPGWWHHQLHHTQHFEPFWGTHTPSSPHLCLLTQDIAVLGSALSPAGTPRDAEGHMDGDHPTGEGSDKAWD